MPYRPSVPRERLAAIGLRQNAGAGPQLQHMEHYPPAAARDAGFCAALTAGLTPDDDDFPPLGAAEEGDWLWDREGKGQTFEMFARQNKKRQPRPGSKIYLLPIAEDASDLSSFPNIETMRAMVEAFFGGLPTRLLPAVTMTTLARGGPPIKTEKRRGWGGYRWTQYNAADILKKIQRTKASLSDAHTLCAFTMHDITRAGLTSSSASPRCRAASAASPFTATTPPARSVSSTTAPPPAATAMRSCSCGGLAPRCATSWGTRSGSSTACTMSA